MVLLVAGVAAPPAQGAGNLHWVGTAAIVLNQKNEDSVSFTEDHTTATYQVDSLVPEGGLSTTSGRGRYFPLDYDGSWTSNSKVGTSTCVTSTTTGSGSGHQIGSEPSHEFLLTTYPSDHEFVLFIGTPPGHLHTSHNDCEGHTSEEDFDQGFENVIATCVHPHDGTRALPREGSVVRGALSGPGCSPSGGWTLTYDLRVTCPDGSAPDAEWMCSGAQCVGRELASRLEGLGFGEFPAFTVGERDPLSVAAVYSLGRFELCELGAHGPASLQGLVSSAGALSLPVTVDGQGQVGPFSYSIPDRRWSGGAAAGFKPELSVDLHPDLEPVDLTQPGVVSLGLVRLGVGKLTTVLIPGQAGGPAKLTAINEPEGVLKAKLDVRKIIEAIRLFRELLPNEQEVGTVFSATFARLLVAELGSARPLVGSPRTPFVGDIDWADSQLRDLAGNGNDVVRGWDDGTLTCGSFCEAVLKAAPDAARAGAYAVGTVALGTLLVRTGIAVAPVIVLARPNPHGAVPARQTLRDARAAAKEGAREKVLPVFPAPHVPPRRFHVAPFKRKPGVQAIRKAIFLPAPGQARRLLVAGRTDFRFARRLTIAAVALPGRARHHVLISVRGPGYAAQRIVTAAAGASVVTIALPRHKRTGTWSICVVDASEVHARGSKLTGRMQFRVGTFAVKRHR